MKFTLGSSSGLKMNALMSACERIGVVADIATSAVESGVNSQPYGLEETNRGALNRAEGAQMCDPNSVAVGIENGLILLGDAHVDLAVVVVLLPSGEKIIGTSTGIQFPNDAVEAARKAGFSSTTAGQIIAQETGASSTDPHSTLTSGYVKRQDALTDALIGVLSQTLRVRQEPR